MKDYYELLEVNKNASDETIKKVFRMLIKKNHPDLFEGEAKLKAEEKVKELNKAYEVLSDSEKRKKYNAELEEKTINTDIAIETLLQENEYLKSVIQEKNNMIREYLQEIGVDTRGMGNKNLDFYGEIYDENEFVDDGVQSGSNNVYSSEEVLKKMMYMTVAIIFGVILLRATTGFSIFRILGNVFKAMF